MLSRFLGRSSSLASIDSLRLTDHSGNICIMALLLLHWGSFCLNHVSPNSPHLGSEKTAQLECMHPCFWAQSCNRFVLNAWLNWLPYQHISLVPPLSLVTLSLFPSSVFECCHVVHGIDDMIMVWETIVIWHGIWYDMPQVICPFTGQSFLCVVFQLWSSCKGIHHASYLQLLTYTAVCKTHI